MAVVNSVNNYFNTFVGSIAIGTIVGISDYPRKTVTDLTTDILQKLQDSNYDMGLASLLLCPDRVSWLAPLKLAFSTHLDCALNVQNFIFESLKQNNTVDILLDYLEEDLHDLELNTPPVPVSSIYISTFIVAAFEELYFRGIVQKIFLTELPRLLLSKILSHNNNLVDKPAVRVFRVALASIFFSLNHMQFWDCDRTSKGIISNIVTGALYGALAETRFGITTTTIAHFIHNSKSALGLNNGIAYLHEKQLEHLNKK